MPGPLGSEAEASPEGIVFRDDHDLVAKVYTSADFREGLEALAAHWARRGVLGRGVVG